MILARIGNRIANAIIRRALRTPYTHLRHASGAPYMDRYWLFRIGRSGTRGQYPWVGARVHHIQSSDDDRAFHDHPWPFVTIILRGGYTEIRPHRVGLTGKPGTAWIGDEALETVTRHHRAGAILLRRARDWHMLKLGPGQTAITLFLTFPMVQQWGFRVAGCKVGWREFERQRGSSGISAEPTPGGTLA